VPEIAVDSGSTPPPEVFVRAASPDDAPAIRDLVNAVDLQDIGVSEVGVEEVLEDLRSTRDLGRDSWLVFAGDVLVAYGVLWDDFGNERIDVDYYVLRDHVEAGAWLLDRMTARAASVAAANGADEAIVHLHLSPTSALVETAHLPERGWSAIRRHYVLTRAVSVQGDSEPTAPAGVTVRHPASAADQESVYRILTTSFADHFDHQEETYEAWRVRMDADALDWSLVWIAALDGEDVGACLGTNRRETMGWVRGLGTLAAARGRGVATYLLRLAFAEFARRGRDTVGLGVDTENATGALRLYQGLGMAVHFTADTWEVRVPARAVDVSTNQQVD
jgi:ribosomal protein S18 acetylase RimI-like enzyme